MVESTTLPWEILGEILFLLFVILSTGVICQLRLIPCIETLCVKHQLREDVAGASIVSFVSSLPLLLLSIITVIQGQKYVDFGLGAVIGSGLTSFTFIPAILGLCSSCTIIIKRRPLLRDIIIYTLSLTVLCWVLWDGYVQLYDSILLIAIYIIYIAILIFAPIIRRYFLLKRGEIDQDNLVSFVELNFLSTPRSISTSTTSYISPNTEALPIYTKPNNSPQMLVDALLPDNSENSNNINYNESEYNFGTKFGEKIDNFIRSLYKLYTKNTFQNSKYERYYYVTFLLCVIWLSLFAIGLSLVSERWAILIGHGNARESLLSFMGILLVGCIGQYTTLLQSIYVLKKGYGNMAISNTLGSQIMNISFIYVYILFVLLMIILFDVYYMHYISNLTSYSIDYLYVSLINYTYV
ncbi:hypothetical protein WA158_000415 [Blastocystis sp. Blastoise]